MENHDHKIKAVLFDLGDTLLSFGKIQETRLFRQGARASYDYLKSQNQPTGPFEIYFLRNLINLQLKRWLSSLTGRDFDSLELLSTDGAKRGIRLDERQWQQFTWRWYEPLSQTARIEPDIKQTMRALTEAGLKLGIVSNTFVNAYSLDRHLEQLGILDFLPMRLYSCQFGFRKPDFRIFRAAAERIGHRPENILFVGDRIKLDIRPALKLGMHAALKDAYTNTGKELPADAIRIHQISELPAIISRINSESADKIAQT